MRNILIYAILILLFLIPTAIKAVDIKNAPISKSPHNLASWATTSTDRPVVKVKAVDENQICKFCHVPHGAIDTPLWGHKLSTATYRTFSSATLRSPRNQPDKGSKLCLSCHDGTVSVGDMIKGNIHVVGTNYVDIQGKILPTADIYFGSDFNDPTGNHPAHPISIAVTDALIAKKIADGDVWKLRNSTNNICGTGKYGLTAGSTNIDCVDGVAGEPIYPLRPTGYLGYNGSSNPNGTGIQCATCHEPHNNQYGKFMRERISFTNWSCAHFNASNYGFCNHCHNR